MSWAYMLYHKEHAPGGETFHAENEMEAYRQSLERAKQGWADSPAKVGVCISPYALEAEREGVKDIETEVLMGRRKRIDPPDDYRPTPEELEEERQRGLEEVRQQEAEAEALRTKETPLKRRKLGDEKLMDQRSKAGLLKKADKAKKNPVSVGAGTAKKRRRKPAPKVEDETTDL